MKTGMMAKAGKNLKEYQMQILDMDELKRVSGGESSIPNAPDNFFLTDAGGNRINAAAASEVLRGIYDTCGRDVAVDYVSNNWVPCAYKWKDLIDEGGPEYAAQYIWGKFYKSYIEGKPVF